MTYFKMKRIPNGKGWHNEPYRHRLARLGVKTAVKDNPESRVRLNNSKKFRSLTRKEQARLFFIYRFGRDPEHRVERDYFNEWVERFESGHPRTYMDEKSQKVYDDLLLGKQGKLPDYKGKGGISVKIVENKLEEDTDGDGVPDKDDCDPKNLKKIKKRD